MALLHGRSEEMIALIKALHLPRDVRGFELRCYVDEAVTIKVEYFPDRITMLNVDQIGEVLKTYELHEVEPQTGENDS